MSAAAGILARLGAKLRAELASRLARDSLLVLCVSVLGRGLALGKEVLVAALFGVGAGLDAYVLALLLPSFLANLLGGAWASTLIPALGKAGDDPAGRALLLRRGLGRQALLLAAACLALALLPAHAFRLLAPGASAATLELAGRLLLALVPLLALGAANAVLAALVNLRGDFRGPALAATLGAAGSLPLIFLLHGDCGPFALAYSADAGALLEFCFLLAPLRRAWGPELRAALCAKGAPTGGETLASQWAQLALGQAMLGLSPFVDNAIAASLGQGAVSALSYAAKLPAGISSLLGLTLATVLLPHLASRSQAAPQELAASCRRILLRVAALSAPVALAGALASPWLVALLFQRGRFDAEAAQLVSGIQIWYFLQLPAYLLGVAAARMLQALQRFRFLFWMPAALVAINAGTSLLFSHLLGAPGIALSSALMYLLSALLSFWALARHWRRA